MQHLLSTPPLLSFIPITGHKKSDQVGVKNMFYLLISAQESVHRCLELANSALWQISTLREIKALYSLLDSNVLGPSKISR
jgi:hypothetical protein